MPENETVVKTVPVPARDQFAKIVLGAAASFAASKLVELGYEAFIVNRRNKAAAEPEQ